MKNKGLFWLFFFLFGGFGLVTSIVGDFFWLILSMVLGLIGMGIALAPGIFMIWGLVKLIQKITGKGSSQSTSRKEKKLIRELTKYASNSYQIQINDEVLIEMEKDPISLNNIAIYIRGEYISSLQEYKNAFPNAFNSMVDLILETIKKKPVQQQVKKEAVRDIKKETTKPQPQTVIKDADYFIDKFNKLDVIIEDEEISNGLVKCQEYLTQISKIEKEFPETREKTGRLYQYYLPMLVDILEEYIRLSENASNHKEFTESQQRLAKTIMLINSALESISVSLCQEYYSNMSVDIKTLEALLKKDGYGNELDINQLRKEMGNE